jgi:hypothetical protein
VADILQTAGVPADAGSRGSGRPVPSRVRLEGDPVAAEVGSPPLEQGVRLQRSAGRTEEGDAASAMPGRQLPEALPRGSEAGGPGGLPAVHLRIARSLRMVGVAVAEAAAVADEESVHLPVDA